MCATVALGDGATLLGTVGDIMDVSLADMVGWDQQRRFGADERDG